MAKVSSNKTGVSKENPKSGFMEFCKNNEQICQWICFIGIILCYSIYAHLQEVLIGNKQPKLTISLILCFQYAIAMGVSAVIIIASGSPGGLTQGLTKGDAIVAFLNFCSMNCSSYAMKSVSYPFVVLSKSAKIIPVILIGTLRGVYTPKPQQFVIAFFITAGLVIFNMNKMLSKSKKEEPAEENFSFGLTLVLMSLAFDGLTQTQTDKNHKSSKRDFAYPSMFTNNLLGLIFSGSMYAYGAMTEGDNTHERIFNSSELLGECVIWGLAGAIGQIFIFFTISLYDCYLLTIITTTRKFFSVVYSNFKFGHNFDNTQWLGASIVMICTFVELFSKKGGKKKVDEKKSQ